MPNESDEQLNLIHNILSNPATMLDVPLFSKFPFLFEPDPLPDPEYMCLLHPSGNDPPEHPWAPKLNEQGVVNESTIIFGDKQLLRNFTTIRNGKSAKSVTLYRLIEGPRNLKLARVTQKSNSVRGVVMKRKVKKFTEEQKELVFNRLAPLLKVGVTKEDVLKAL